MVITFVSNYINHHQIPFCRAMFEELGARFHFIQTQPMTQERIRMGWSVDVTEIPYVSLLYEDEAYCRSLIAESDVVLLGWSGRADLDKLRLQSGKPTIRISERIYREGQWKAISPRGLISNTGNITDTGMLRYIFCVQGRMLHRIFTCYTAIRIKCFNGDIFRRPDIIATMNCANTKPVQGQLILHGQGE